MTHEALHLQHDEFPSRVEQEWGRLAMDAGAVITFDWNVATDVLSIDAAGKDLLGLSNEPAVCMSHYMSRVHHEDAGRLKSNLNSILCGETATIDELRIVTASGETVHLNGRCSVLTDADGHRHMVGIQFDCSPQARQGSAKLNPAEEKSHQIKNILGVISGIATMTQLTLAEPADFLASFNSRLQALAKSADHAAAAADGFMPLAGFVMSVAGAFAGGRKIEVDDCPCSIDADVCQIIAIAVHELTVNAVRHGAFSVPDGAVKVRFNALDDGSLRLVWQESRTGFAVPEDPRRGFGWQILTRVVAREFDTQPELEWTPDGLRYTLNIGADRLQRLPEPISEAD